MILLPMGLKCERCNRKYLAFSRSAIPSGPPDGWSDATYYGYEEWVCADCTNNLQDAGEESGSTDVIDVSESCDYFAVIEVPG